MARETQLKIQINLINNRFAKRIGSSGRKLEMGCIYLLLDLEENCHACLDKKTTHKNTKTALLPIKCVTTNTSIKRHILLSLIGQTFFTHLHLNGADFTN